MRLEVSPHTPRRAVELALTVALTLACTGVTAAGTLPSAAVHAPVTGLETRDWVWPVHPVLVVEPYVAPAHPYGPGHRGVDLRPLGSTALRSPASGVVAFRGAVAGRAVLTIDHGDGLVTTFEPVDSPLAAGTLVERGEIVGTVSLGGHAAPGTVHFGVRLFGEYINPLLLLGGVPRAVLLPCC